MVILGMLYDWIFLGLPNENGISQPNSVFFSEMFMLFTVMGIAFFKGLPIMMLLKSVEYEYNRSRYVMICLDLKYI